MKKLYFFNIIFFMILGVSNVFAQIINISNTTHICEYPFVLPFDNNVLVVWAEKDSAVFNLYYRVNLNGEWSSKKRIFATEYNSEYPNLALDSSGRVYMVWMEGTSRANREIYYSIFYNNRWTTKQKVYASSWNSAWPRIGIDSNNRAHCIWIHELYPYNNTKYDIIHSIKNSSWSSNPLNVSNTSSTISIHPALYVRGTNAYACWMDGSETNWYIYFSEYDGSRWSRYINISPSLMGWWPSIVADSKGNVHITYATLKSKVYYVNRIDGIWSTPKPISNRTHVRDFSFLDIDNENVIHGAWRERYNDHNNIFYSTADRFGNWSIPKLVSNGIDCRTPVIKADNRGFVHIVWFDEGINNGEVFYTKVKAGEGGIPGQSPEATFTANPNKGKPPLKVTFDASLSNDPDGEIVSYEWDFGDGTTGSGKIIKHTFNNRGTYKVVLIVRDDSGLTDSYEYNIIVSDPPIAKFVFAPEKGIAPLTVHFDATESKDPDGYIKNYIWLFGDDASSNTKICDHTFTEPGIYNVILEVVDNVGLTSTATCKIEVFCVYPPSNIKVDFNCNKTLFFKEYFNKITWERNPLNEQHNVNIVFYRIYRKENSEPVSSFKELITLNSNTFCFYDRNLNETDKNRYVYLITSIDDKGNESKSIYNNIININFNNLKKSISNNVEK